MSRIAQICTVSIDLDNIKEIRFKKRYKDKDPEFDDATITIKLLRGKEYVYNPQNKEWEMLEAEIIVEFRTVAAAKSFQLQIESKWQEYLSENVVKGKTKKSSDK